MGHMREQFLAGTEVVLDAVTDERVIAAWHQASALEDQTIGSLASHTARGCWVVDQYLDKPTPPGPANFATAAEYFAQISDSFTETDHVEVRNRGAEVASAGPASVGADLAHKLPGLRLRLVDEPEDRLIEVYGGNVMGLDDYLWTRIVEQVVHLEDLARSLKIEPWQNPPDAEALVIGCGAEVGRLRRGGPAMIRALYRDRSIGEDSILPVM